MSIRSASVAAFVVLLLSSSIAVSSPLPDEPTAASAASTVAATPRNGKDVARIDDVEEYLQRTRDVIERAHEGDYGSIRKRDMDRVIAAQQSIENVLGNREGEIVLTLDEQIQLANAQESINAIIRADDKSRIVCRRVAALGTRIAKNECLSVARREQMAETARQIIKTSNDFCVPGVEGVNSCGR